MPLRAWILDPRGTSSLASHKPCVRQSLVCVNSCVRRADHRPRRPHRREQSHSGACSFNSLRRWTHVWPFMWFCFPMTNCCFASACQRQLRGPRATGDRGPAAGPEVGALRGLAAYSAGRAREGAKKPSRPSRPSIFSPENGEIYM